MDRAELKILYKAGGGLIGTLAPLVYFNILTLAEALNITLVFFLVLVTAMYARRTADIARATKEQAEATKQQAEVTRQQADASVKMAEEMRLQRLAAKPVVVPDVDIHYEDKDYDSKMGDLAQSDFPVILTNVGTAAALELEVRIEDPMARYAYEELPLLLPNATWRGRIPIVDVNAEGEAIFDQPPFEGVYQLKVTFKSVDSLDVKPLEVVLPFELTMAGDDWLVIRKKLHFNITG